MGIGKTKTLFIIDQEAIDDGYDAVIFVNTNTAAAGGVIAALITAKLMFGKADLTMALNGALAGLVSITAEPLTPSPLRIQNLVVCSITGSTPLDL